MCRKSIKKKLAPRLAEAQAGKRAVFFVDAAHFVFGAFLGYLWCFARCWIKAPSGRQRFNVLGALHAITHEVITVTNCTYINAESVCQLLRKLGALGLQVPITLVLDNARDQRCALVQSVADTLGIELLYLPAYAAHSAPPRMAIQVFCQRHVSHGQPTPTVLGCRRMRGDTSHPFASGV